MSSRGVILLAVGMLILGLLIGLMSGGVAGFFIGQNSRVAFNQNFQQTLPQGRFTNPQANPTPQAPQGQQQQPNANATPFSRRGNNGNGSGGNGSGFPPAASVLNGARVDAVVANTPASQAGLQVGDIITAVGPTKLDVNHTLSDLIGTYKPGDKVDLSVTRGSQTLIVSVTLGTNSTDSTKAYLGIQYSTMPGGQFRFPNG